MSGIAGILVRDGGADRTAPGHVLHGLSHRGPDEALPLRSADGRLCLTADARVDNREELRAELRARGAEPRADTDAELILCAYATWGEECPRKILGDFAFAVWDAGRQHLFCARDPLGVKPFYYRFDGGTFRWASEPAALFAGGAASREPNRALLCLYLLGHFHEREETLDAGVYRLPPAHGMVVKGGTLRKTRYWEVDPSRTVRYRTDEDYAEHFLHLFRDGVRARLRGRGPAGALLSGGLDSSAVVCAAPGAGLEAYSILFSQLPCDERSYIEEVVRQSGVATHYFDCEDGRASLDFEESEACPDVAWFPTMLMLAPALRAAAARGVRVMLDGVGGDDCLTASFDHLTDLVSQGRLGKLVSQLHHDAADSGYAASSLFVNYCLRPFVPRPVRTALRPLLAPFRDAGPPAWLDADCLRQEGIPERLRAVPKTPRFPTRSQQAIHDGLVSGWNTNVALGEYGRFASRFGLEARHPFLDRRLVEYLLAVPEEQRWDGQWRKAVLRRALRGVMPEAVRRRKSKADFSPIIDREIWQRQAGKVRRLLRTSALAELGVVRGDRLCRLFDRGLGGTPDPHTRAVLQHVIWLELRCRSAGVRPGKEKTCA